MDIGNEKYILAQTQAAASQAEAVMPPAEIPDSGGERLEGPDMEEQAISNFPERSDIGSRGTCTAYGVKAEANTEWFSNKAIQKGLQARGKLGEIANSPGKI